MMPDRNPFQELERMFEQMNRQFEQSPWSMGQEGMFGRGSVDIDLADHGEEFVVTADLPGFEKENIDVQCTEEQLTIRAERERETETSEENYLRRERSDERMQRSVRLPEPIDADGVSATFQNGVLTVTLPKAGSSDRGQNIDIE
ncbi:Hsp20/alpha crystallin family protein [Halopelagius longus]|uniref:HSP20 family protein n=1 Tax=Halopelagius longus TaxID=1236180 RepID=A0A1H1FLP1_9EURY|nr:Hsp20/alpha crystallin family protein [Halopelagius longus]RDI70044.1 Hsp20/alpha crystallin family protein [Halopelagius longus]SDR01738.1 HSP20 family protein [Halopelagius longus]